MRRVYARCAAQIAGQFTVGFLASYGALCAILTTIGVVP